MPMQFIFLCDHETVFFSLCTHISHHPQEDLAKFVISSMINCFCTFVVVLQITKTRV